MTQRRPWAETRRKRENGKRQRPENYSAGFWLVVGRWFPENFLENLRTRFLMALENLPPFSFKEAGIGIHFPETYDF